MATELIEGVQILRTYLGIEHSYVQDIYGTLYDRESIELYIFLPADESEDQVEDLYMNVVTGDKFAFDDKGHIFPLKTNKRDMLEITGWHSVKDSVESLLHVVSPFVDRIENGEDIITYFSEMIDGINNVVAKNGTPILPIEEFIKLVNGKENIYFLCYGNPFDNQSSLQCLQGFLKNNKNKIGTNKNKNK